MLDQTSVVIVGCIAVAALIRFISVELQLHDLKKDNSNLKKEIKGRHQSLRKLIDSKAPHVEVLKAFRLHRADHDTIEKRWGVTEKFKEQSNQNFEDLVTSLNLLAGHLGLEFNVKEATEEEVVLTKLKAKGKKKA